MMNIELKEVGGVFTSLREAITGEKIIDPIKQAELVLAMETIEADLKKAQMLVNAAEANHPSIFVAGWRPFIGWTGGFALAYNYIAQPFIYTVLAANKIVLVMPTLDIGTLMMLITGLLGFGGFRTLEKVKGVTRGAK